MGDFYYCDTMIYTKKCIFGFHPSKGICCYINYLTFGRHLRMRRLVDWGTNHMVRGLEFSGLPLTLQEEKLGIEWGSNDSPVVDDSITNVYVIKTP